MYAYTNTSIQGNKDPGVWIELLTFHGVYFYYLHQIFNFDGLMWK